LSTTYKKVNDKRLVQYDHYVEKQSKKVTNHEVYLRLSKKLGSGKKPVVAELQESPPQPRSFDIVFNKSWYNKNKNKPAMIKKIIGHELAHINHPNTHGPAFQKEAKKLGGYTTPGLKKVKKGAKK
jgi:hypothetical protein